MKATFKLNPELNGIEIYFETYPGKDIVDKLHEMKSWRWHKVKKCWYAKQTEENLNFAKTICDSDIEVTKLQSTENVHGVKVGDIYYTSWGYDMTIVDFFQVVDITAKRAKVKEINSKIIEGHTGSGKVIPVKDSFKDDVEIISTGTNTSYDGKSTILKNCDGHGHIGYKYDNNPCDFNYID